MADRIDFPNDPIINQIFESPPGTIWKYSDRGSWVKQFSYVEQSPGVADVEYCRKNLAWSPIIYPVADDIPGDVAASYSRTSDGADNASWQVVDFGAAGPAFTGPDDALYGVRGPAGTVWEEIPAGDSVYLKTEINTFLTGLPGGTPVSGYSQLGHTHLGSEIDYGAGNDISDMAFEDDAPDSAQYARVVGGWEPVAQPTLPIQRTSITIIDPIDTDDSMMFWTPTAITLKQIRTWVRASGNAVVYNVYFNDAPNNDSGGITKAFTSDQSCNSNDGCVPPAFDNVSIPADNWVWLEIISVTGSPLMFHLTITYEEDVV